MFKNVNIDNILNFLATNLPITQKLAGIYIGGSTATNFADDSSDIDLCIYLQGTAIDISKEHTFYDHKTNLKVECLFWNFLNLINLPITEFKGYRSEAFYWMTISKVYKETPQSTATLQVLTKYKPLWINLCLKGYLSILENLFIKAEKAEFNNISLIEAKKLYRLCYMYNQMINTEVSQDLLYRIKKNKLDSLTLEELTLLKNVIKNLSSKYLIWDLWKEFTLLKRFKEEIYEIWK